MNSKPSIWIGSVLGSYLGSLIPYLWGDGGFLTFSGVIFEALGAILGIYIGFKITHE